MTMMSDDIFKLLDDFLISAEIGQTNCIGICTDGASAMPGKYSGVVQKIKSLHLALSERTLAYTERCLLMKILNQVFSAH